MADVVVVQVEEILLRRPGWRLRLKRCTYTHRNTERERQRDKETKRQNCENRTRKTDFNQGS